MRLWMGYLHHRWAIDAAMKYVGGQYQNIVLKGDTLKPAEPVPAALQRSILALLMEAIQPASLAIPDQILEQSAGVSARGATRKTWQTTTSSTTCGRRGFLPGRFSSSCWPPIGPHDSWRSPIARPSADLCRSAQDGCGRHVGCAARLHASRTFASAGDAARRISMR